MDIYDRISASRPPAAHLPAQGFCLISNIFPLPLVPFFPPPPPAPGSPVTARKPLFMQVCGLCLPFFSSFLTAYSPVPGLTAHGPGGCRKQGARGWFCARKKDPKYGFTYLRSLFYPFFASKTVHFVAESAYFRWQDDKSITSPSASLLLLRSPHSFSPGLLRSRNG